MKKDSHPFLDLLDKFTDLVTTVFSFSVLIIVFSYFFRSCCGN